MHIKNILSDILSNDLNEINIKISRSFSFQKKNFVAVSACDEKEIKARVNKEKFVS